MKPLVSALAIAVVAAVIVATVFFAPGLTGGTTTSASTTSVSSTSTSSTSTGESSGLQLRLSLNATSVKPGGAIEITASEYNTLSTQVNITKASDWAVQGLSLGPCATEGYSNYPFGVAVFQGRYTQANVSQGKPLEIYGVVACPMLLRYVTGYLFEPMNDSAVILPSSDSYQTLMSGDVTVSGTYAGLPSNAVQPLAPGTYTVVAGDEWGAVETLQFTVTG